MPQSVDSLPPPAVEWRRESDNERRERLERAGVLNSVPAQSPLAGSKGAGLQDSATAATSRFVGQVQEHSEKAKKQYTWWWGVDLARWHPVKSPRETSTFSDGSFGLFVELTHPTWNTGNFQIGFGPKAVFYHGGQYARLDDPLFQGNGYAKFVSSELGLAAQFTRWNDTPHNAAHGFWSTCFYYLPVRWITAEASSSANMIARSDTYSRTSLSLPGVGLQFATGYAWNSFAKAELFAALQGAWPLQFRSRVGIQLSLALTNDEIFFATP